MGYPSTYEDSQKHLDGSGVEPAPQSAERMKSRIAPAATKQISEERYWELITKIDTLQKEIEALKSGEKYESAQRDIEKISKERDFLLVQRFAAEQELKAAKEKLAEQEELVRQLRRRNARLGGPGWKSKSPHRLRPK